MALMCDHLSGTAAECGMLDRGVPAKHRFQCPAVDQPDDPPQGRWNRCALHFRRESGLKQCKTLVDERTQGRVGLRPAQETEDAEQKDVGQTITLRLLAAGIGHARQHLYKRVIHRCNLSLPHHGKAWWLLRPGIPISPRPMPLLELSSLQLR
jgi:hypothetical protein